MPPPPPWQTALERFFDALYQALLRHVDFTSAKAVLLASPAYVREDFRTFLMEQAVRKRDVVRGAMHAACVCLCVCLCVYPVQLFLCWDVFVFFFLIHCLSAGCSRAGCMGPC